MRRVGVCTEVVRRAARSRWLYPGLSDNDRDKKKIPITID
jgi:hypothetical protein